MPRSNIVRLLSSANWLEFDSRPTQYRIRLDFLLAIAILDVNRYGISILLNFRSFAPFYGVNYTMASL